MGNNLDSSALLRMNPRELALHLRHASEKQSARTVSISLLEAIELESLPPTVFDTFLTSVKSPWPFKEALLQSYSKQVRHAAIRRFGKDLKGVNWEDAWQEVGGTKGLLDLFLQLSVLEVKELCEVIGRCPGRIMVRNHTERQGRITELLQCLLSFLYPSSPYKSNDQRTLHSHYAKMVPACTSDFVESLFRHESHPLLELLPKKMLVQHHFELLRRLVLNSISHGDSVKGVSTIRILNYIPSLLQSAPSLPVVEPRFSTSMSLAVAILERITAGQESRFPESIFMSVLMVPLMRRLQAHSVDPSRTHQIVRLAAKYLQRNERARAQLSLERRNLMCYIAKAWSSTPSLFEECLTEFISLLRGRAQRDLSCYQDLIHQAAKFQRYNLLRIICMHSTDTRTEIDVDDELSSVPIKRWPIFIFQILQRDHGLCLLKRLVRLNPEANFLELPANSSVNRTILSQARLPDSNFGDPHLLLAILEPKKKGVEHEALKNILGTLKSKASTSKEQSNRAFFAKSAAFHAIASGSLEVYDETVQWTRRFLRDAMTVKTLYSPDTTLTVEGVAMLGGVPDDLVSWNTAEIFERITKANTIMLNLLDAAVTSLREPSFYAPDWYGPFSLFLKVILIRMSNAGRLKTHFELSDDRIYELLWSQTIEMLLRAEEIGLQYERLNFNSPHGPLGFSCHIGNMPLSASPSTYRFLDNLARSRDALWKRWRPTIDPAVAALEPPWPRGLPIQCLAGPFHGIVLNSDAQTPFIAERATGVVKADPAIALVEVTADKETRRSIGQFIDSFDVALQLYVMQCSQGHEQGSRVHAAWSHAINVLSHGPSPTSLHSISGKHSVRMSESEAEVFWGKVFERTLPEMKVPAAERKVDIQYPVLPSEIDPGETFEWNPAAMVPPDTESRTLPVTVLDCMVAAPRRLQWSNRHDFVTPKAETQAIVHTPIWSPQRLEYVQKLAKAVQEGMIAAALLLESSIIEGSNILAAPFPSESNVRYPSLFLDHDYLLSSDNSQASADYVLSQFIKIVPSTLLLDLTTSALEALSRTPLDSPKLAATEHMAYRLLKLLSKSDRPHLASTLIVRTVIDCPDASSWHRQLLSRKFLKDLSAGQAQDIFSLFASSILETLERQVTLSRNRQNAKASGINSDRPIKITTVKFLAQLLDDASFLPPELCVDILSKLFQTATHVDIRVAVLDSMLSRLGRCLDVTSDALAERLMSALELTIPTLGSLNERQQIHDEDWIVAEKSGKLPEIYDEGGMREVPPMLDLMLDAMTINGIPSDRLRTGFIQRIVLPVIEKSRKESARWVKLFTLKHLPADQPIRTPSFPVRPRVLEYVIEECSREIPTYILDLYQQFFLTNVAPPAGLVTLNEKVNSDRELSNSNEGQYWLSLYNQGADVSTSAIVKLLTKPQQLSATVDKDLISHVQGMVLEQANALLQLADASFRRWDGFMAALDPPLAEYQNDQYRSAWLENGKPILLRILEKIDSLRTPEWQRDRHRQPAVLPDTFRHRLWLLDYPQLCRSSSDACVTFVQQVLSVLREVIDAGLWRHVRLDDIRSALSRCWSGDSVRVACWLGSVDLEDSTKVQENLLRVELADGMLLKYQSSPDKSDEIWLSLKTILEAWRGCEVEDIRMRGIRLGRQLKM